LGGGGIPLQYIAMYSQDATTHQFKPFSIWTITYFSPFRYPTALILESVTQGPAFNAGTLTPDQWNQDIIQDLFSEGNFTTLASYKSMHLGYSSIFDIKHAFITNLVPIPYFNFDLGDGNVWNTWYVDKCSGAIYMPYIHTKIIDTWQLNPIIYGAYWSGDINEIFNTGVPAWFPIKNIPTFAFAQPVDKILDLIIPFAISALFLGGSMALYRKNIINSRG
jgi:hypothetical protein